MTANIHSMAYVGEKPWHGLGTPVDHAMTAEEAIVAAGLDWRVRLDNARTEHGLLMKTKAVVREDLNVVIGEVGAVYRPLQNKEAFSFFDAVVGTKEAIYHTAGSLGFGEKIWLLAKLPGEIKVINDDIVNKFLLLANSHDGTMKVTMLFTPIRVVCQNTLNGALSVASNKATVKHTKSMGLKISEVQKTLGIINQKYVIFEELSKRLASKRLQGSMLEDYFKACIGVKDNVDDLPTRTKNTIDSLKELHDSGKGSDIPGVRGTLWGAYNTITEYVDFHRTTRGTDAEKQENRADSLLFGSGAVLKERAWNIASELLVS